MDVLTQPPVTTIHRQREPTVYTQVVMIQVLATTTQVLVVVMAPVSTMTYVEFAVELKLQLVV